MRLLLSVVLLASLAVTACSDDSGEPDADYLDRSLAAWAERSESLVEADCDLGFDQSVPVPCDYDQWREATEHFQDAWSALHPPEIVEREHRRVETVVEELVDVLATRQSDDSRGKNASEEAAVEAEADVLRAQSSWMDAASHEYNDVTLFRFDGASMEPSFSDGEIVIVQDLQRASAVHGDVLAFRFHLDEDRYFIKRVIGLSGETVEVRDGIVFIDGTALVEDYILAKPNYTYGPKTVPSGHYFVLGDNRHNSFDSHAWGQGCPGGQCEFVPEENIIGVLAKDGQPLDE